MLVLEAGDFVEQVAAAAVQSSIPYLYAGRPDDWTEGPTEAMRPRFPEEPEDRRHDLETLS